MKVYELAYQIWNDLDEPSEVTTSYISGWLVNPANVGKLNNKIGTCYDALSGVISPELGQEEASIYSEIYQALYYKQKINEKLGAGGIAWTEMRDGDGVLRRASPTEEAKVYKDLFKESNIQLKDLIQNYRANLGFPRTNDFSPP